MEGVQPWGHAPTPLLPAVMRSALAGLRVPPIVVAALGREVAFVDLDESCWRNVSSVPEVALDALAVIVSGNLDRLQARRVDGVVPDSELIRTLPLRTRTRNCGLQLASRFAGSQPTIGELLGIRNFGNKSLLDLLCVLEAASDELPIQDHTASGQPARLTVPSFVSRAFGSREAPPAFWANGDPRLVRDLAVGHGTTIVGNAIAQREQLVGWFHGMLREAADAVVIEKPPALSLDEWGLSPETRALVGERPAGDLAQVTVGELSGWGLDARAILELAAASDECRASDPSLLKPVLDEAWPDMVSGSDPRFRDLVYGSDTVAERIRHLLSTQPASGEVAALASSIERIRMRLAELDEVPFDSAIAGVIGGSINISGDRLRAMLGRYGLVGSAPVTLEEAGQRLGVTRERIRQIGVKVQKALPSHELWLPTLDEAIEVVARRLPLDDVGLTALLRRRGLVEGELTASSFIEHCRFAHRDVPFVVGDDDRLHDAKDLAAAADRRAQVSDVLAGARRLLKPFQIGELAYLECVLTDEDIEFGDTARDELDEVGAVWIDGSWFWIQDRAYGGQTPLERTVETILCVSHPEPVRIDAVVEGLSRRSRWRGGPPMAPVPVVESVLARIDGLSVNGGMVCSLATLDPEAILPDSELTMFKVLRGAGGALDRETFEKRCVEASMNAHTFTVMTTYSPIIEHLAANVWGLRGVEPTREAMARASGPIERVDRNLGTRPTSTGFDYAYRLGGRVSPVIGIPRGLRPYVAGRSWLAVDASGTEVGTIAVSDDSAWGFAPFLGSQEVDEDGVLMIGFNIESGVVTVEVEREPDLSGFS